MQDNMQAGEKELREVFEEVTTNNLKAVLEYSKNTRELVREMEIKVNLMENQVLEQNKLIDALKIQLSLVQAKLYSGGS